MESIVYVITHIVAGRVWSTSDIEVTAPESVLNFMKCK